MDKRILVEKVAAYIEEHLGEELSLDKIAAELHYSKYYLARAFTEKAGCTIYQYIQGRRLTLAAQELVETGKPIVEIACEAQYGSQQAFALAFKRRYLCTPRIYREQGVFYPVQNVPFDGCSAYMNYGLAGYVPGCRVLGSGRIRRHVSGNSRFRSDVFRSRWAGCMPGSHGLGGCTGTNCMFGIDGSVDYMGGGAIAA